MITSPPPSQTVPTRTVPEAAPPETKAVKLTPAKKRMGQTPTALRIKSLLRPVLKVLYYVITWIRVHKLASLGAIFLLLASIFLTTFFVTGEIPLFGSGQVDKDIKQHLQLSQEGQEWLMALRQGDIETMRAVEKNMNLVEVPDDASFTLQYSEARANIQWTSIKQVSSTVAADKLIDIVVEVDYTEATTSGTATIYSFWRFTVDSRGNILLIRPAGDRPK